MINYNVSLDKIKLTLKVIKPKRGTPYLSRVSTWVERNAPRLGEVRDIACDDMRLTKYRYACTVTPHGCNEGILYVAWWYNGDFQCQREQPERVKIEFNPNKSGLELYKHLWQSLLLRVVSIDAFDLAYDVLGKSTRDVILDTRCDVMTYGNSLAKTLYVSPKETVSGRIKVYDKDVERLNQGVHIEQTLRIEVSVKNPITLSLEASGKITDKEADTLTKLCNRLQSVKIRSQGSLTEMGWELYALSQLTPSELENTLSLMSKNTRSKYRALIRTFFFDTLNIDVFTLKLHITELLAPYILTMRPYCDERSTPDVYAR